MKKIACHDMDNKLYEVNTDQLIYRPSVYGRLIEDEKVLLCPQYDGYDFPGGGAEINETLQEAVEREFFEETGFKVKVLEPLYCKTSFFNPVHSKKEGHQFWNCLVIFFKVEKISGELTTEHFDEEEKEYADLAEWIDLSEIDKIKYVSTAINGPEVIRRASTG